jgi:2-phospho-L-lactate guanylyltransferase
MDAGILAVKRLDQAKQRLDALFSAAERAEVARALLTDAFQLITDTGALRWWVVSDDPEVLEEAARRGFDQVQDEGRGLNAALLRGVDSVVAAGADSVTILPADLPLAKPLDVEAILETGATSEMVIVPAGDGGTNALHLTPPDLIPPTFGPKSLQAHIKAADERRLRRSILPLERMALDIDTPEDVEELLEKAGEEETSDAVALLRRLRPTASARTTPDQTVSDLPEPPA